MEFTNSPQLVGKRSHRRNSFVRGFPKRGNDIPAEMIAAAFLKCGITNSLDGSEDDVVYESTEDANELNLDDSFVRELFASDSESEFEGF